MNVLYILMPLHSAAGYEMFFMLHRIGHRSRAILSFFTLINKHNGSQRGCSIKEEADGEEQQKMGQLSLA